MESRITHFCLINDFFDIDFKSDDINKLLKIDVDEILELNSFNDPHDWILTFNANYNNGRDLLISKNKLGSYKADKVKEITIVIPIPSKDVVVWGVRNESYIYNVDHYDSIGNNFYSLKVDYLRFNNRTEYIIDCMRRGIKKAFQEGFTVGGTKIITNKFPPLISVVCQNNEMSSE